MKKLIIIDGNAIVHRAYHALPPLTTKNGKIVNAVYGFTSMLLKTLKDLRPTHIAVTFDLAGPTFRHLKYKEYKATRVKADQELYDQLPLAHDIARAFNMPIYEKKGFEADDAIGTIVKKAKNDKDIEIFIVTGDMDTLQLVEKNVKVYTLRKGLSDTIIYDEEAVKNRFGFGPESVVDYKALRGDASDNIKGVAGIGEKTATELIQKIGGIEKIYKDIKSPKSETRKLFSESVVKKLVAGESDANMSYELAQLDCDAPDLNFKLDDCEIKDFDREKIIKLFQELEFTSLLKRVPGGEALIQDTKFKTQNPRHQNLKFKPACQQAGSKDFVFSEIKSKAEVKKLVDLIKKEKRFACKEVLAGKDIFMGELKGLVFVVGENGFFLGENFIGDCAEIFTDSSAQAELIGHDLKQLIKALAFKNINKIKNKIFDAMIASYLLNPGSRAHDVANIVLKFLGKELPATSGQNSLFGPDAEKLSYELFLVSQAVEKLKEELVKIDDYGLFQKVEMPLTAVLAKMEMNGVKVDTVMLAKLSEEIKNEIKKVSGKIYKMAGKEFNISSPLQLREILFEKLEIPVEGIKKGKTGLSTSAEELEKMRGLHPIIEEIGNYREFSKLQNTYIDVLPALIDKKTGRIHANFNQAITATGRLSSSDPNLQNIPIRTELGNKIREAFIAEKDYLLVSADYSQIELRIVASLAKDKKMMEIFEKDEDIHIATAAAINGVPLEKVTKEMRRAAKEINFGVLYGMGAYGLSWRADISRWQAKEFIEKYFREFSGVKKYIDETLEFTRKEGYCETLFGRRRYIPELKSSNFQLRGAAERMAVNHPVQGTAADLIKMAMVEINVKISEKEAKMILQVHDELVFEVKKELAEEIGEKVKKIMEDVVKLLVPVKVEVETGKRWGEMK
ncbi:MAG: DNA polymerase I [Patescibacteria group bacterium]|nr:DNA polymerase I [Patescibacteria group bacterium]